MTRLLLISKLKMVVKSISLKERQLEVQLKHKLAQPLRLLVPVLKAELELLTLSNLMQVLVALAQLILSLECPVWVVWPECQECPVCLACQVWHLAAAHQAWEEWDQWTLHRFKA